jgi:hypothetical protein
MTSWWRHVGVHRALVAMALVGCGSRSGIAGAALGDGGAGYRWEAGASGGAARAPRSCVEDWHVLYESEVYISTSLAMADGELIFGVSAESGPEEIRALDVRAPSRSRRVVRTGLSDDLWIEGDDVLFWTPDRVIRVPLQGGAEEVLFDARRTEAAGRVDAVWVEPDVIYWARTENDSTRLELWQQPREGGPPGLVGSVDRGAIQAQGLAATGERVILAGGRSAVVFSLSGAAPQPLAEVSDGSFAGVDGLGAYFVRVANRTRRGGRAIEFEIRRAPVDGSPSTRLWRGPAGQHLVKLWPAESGWFAIGTNYMFDGRPHAVIAHIDPAGDATLIACDRGDNRLWSRPVFWQQAFYAATLAGDVWRIVEIRLPE